MKAAVLQQYRHFEFQNVPTPEPQKGQVLVKVGYAGICGSDQHIFNGDFHPRTRTPFIPGHEFAGTVVATGSDVKHHRVGDRVAVDPIIPCGKCAACQLGHSPACTSLRLLGVDLDGGFGEYVLADEHMLFKLDNNISERDAALVELYSIGFHACKRAEITENDTTVIWGAGRVGHSILQAVRTKTSNLMILVDILDNRLANIQNHFENVILVNALRDDPIAVIKEATDGRGVDIAFEAVGHAHIIPERPNPVRGCVQSVRGAGTVCVLGLSDEPAPIVMKELIWREARIVASRVSHGEFSEAIQHLSAGHLKPEAMITAILPISKAQDAFEILEKEPDKYLKILLQIAE